MATKKLSDEEKAARAKARSEASAAAGAARRQQQEKRETVVSAPALGGIVESLPSGGTVTVGCKIPQGLILTVSVMVDAQEPVLGGGVRTFKVAQDSGRRVYLKGSGRDIAKVKGNAVAVNEYALTHGVNADFFGKWLEQHIDSDIVKNGLVFAVRDEQSGRDKGREMIDQRTGFEGLNPKSKDNPKGDPRVPRPSNPQLSQIEQLSTKEDA